MFIDWLDETTTQHKENKMYDYITDAQKEFAKYGFITCPLTPENLSDLYHANIDQNTVYGIGCDVNAGVTFLNAVLANLTQQKES